MDAIPPSRGFMPLDNFRFILARLDPALAADPDLKSQCSEMHTYFAKLEHMLVQPKDLGLEEPESRGYAKWKRTRDARRAALEKQKRYWAAWFLGLKRPLYFL